MPKHRTSVTITIKTLKFLERDGNPTSDQLDRDADMLREILHLVDGDEGECPLGSHIKSLCRLRSETTE